MTKQSLGMVLWPLVMYWMKITIFQGLICRNKERSYAERHTKRTPVGVSAIYWSVSLIQNQFIRNSLSKELIPMGDLYLCTTTTWNNKKNILIKHDRSWRIIFPTTIMKENKHMCRCSIALNKRCGYDIWITEQPKGLSFRMLYQQVVSSCPLVSFSMNYLLFSKELFLYGMYPWICVNKYMCTCIVPTIW